MKNIIKVMSLVLMFCMLFSMVACGNTAKDTTANTEAAGTDGTTADTSSTQTPTDKYADIAGEYLLDASNLGMPMKWYIKVTADGKFQISTARDYATLKGEGTVGDKDGTYMLVYSDSTTEAPKTATFKFEGKNMVFSTNVPIGAASVSPNEDQYPVAKLIANEDILGTYLGTYEKVAMGTPVVYSFSIELVIGNEYVFTSSFTMGANSMTLTETGSFDVKDGKISFTAKAVDGTAVETPATIEGTIADKTIKAAFKLSSMASAPQEIEAKLGVYADIAGTYTGLYEKAMGPTMTLKYNTTLTIDAFGGYKYSTASATDNTVDYTEEGTYTYADGKFTFTSNKEGAAAVEGALANYVLTTKLPISAMMSTPVDVTFYAEEVSGKFTSETEDEGKKFVANLYLVGNTFTIDVLNDKSEVCYVAAGTFEIKKAMLTTVELTTTALYKDAEMKEAVTEIPAELKAVSAPVAESGINAELPFDLDDSKLIGFQFAK
ncbi:MAG: hypothetical protein IJE84_04090 [Clostridia bacterium]|nr:hypothetical protein [Clostridia bacterium]